MGFPFVHGTDSSMLFVVRRFYSDNKFHRSATMVTTTKRRKMTGEFKTSRGAIQQFDLLNRLQPVETRTSSVTTGWKV